VLLERPGPHILAEDGDVRVVVLTGDENAFAAGADFPKPVIAAVNGFALGLNASFMLLTGALVAARQAQQMGLWCPRWSKATRCHGRWNSSYGMGSTPHWTPGCGSNDAATS
jgi:1,4-dihydroxy-2-naphthoyl-CoA synthase